MALATKALACLVFAVTAVVAVAGEGSDRPSSPTASPSLGSVVFQFEIHRTTEPLSLFNAIPPPVPLQDVRRLKGEPGTSATLAAKEMIPETAAILPTSGPARRPVLSKVPSKPRTPLPPPPSIEDRKKPAKSSTPATTPSPPQPLPPMPTFRDYPDTVVLVGGQSLSCRILAETESAVRVELDTQVIIHLPRHRIASLTRKASSP